jgi:coenzyme F420-reducing hydrogenase gamma subunit
MSLLDLDEAIVAVAQKIELRHGPLVDAQEFPLGVDVTLVEGAVSSQEDLDRIHQIRAHDALVAMGDCAVTGNVPAMRNAVPVGACCATCTRHDSVRGRAFVAQARAAGARVRQSRPHAAGMSAVAEVDRRRDRERTRGKEV